MTLRKQAGASAAPEGADAVRLTSRKRCRRSPFDSDGMPSTTRAAARCITACVLTAWFAFALADAPHDSKGTPDDAATIASMRAAFEAEVHPRLSLPDDELAARTTLLETALARSGIWWLEAQFVVVVDRSPNVQVLLLLLGSPQLGWQSIGATPVSTGQPGRFEHFQTPLGVFEHSLANPDFRAEGTKNELGIRGYGRKGARIFDFGWVAAPKGWGDHATSVMRLQMHATDPDILEPRLGAAQSKGCIRIPATLDAFLDRRAILDADYDEALAGGARFWVLREDRVRPIVQGRYLVVVDSATSERPPWSPWPAALAPPAPRRR